MRGEGVTDGRGFFVDTNLFLCFLTNDVPEQADAVERLFRRAADNDIALVTSSLVMAEIVWTLESFYYQTKEVIQRKILAILNTPGLEVADGEMVLQAILWYVEKNVDFIDACNAAWAIQRGIQTVCTFDRKHFARFEGLSVLAPEEINHQGPVK